MAGNWNAQLIVDATGATNAVASLLSSSLPDATSLVLPARPRTVKILPNEVPVRKCTPSLLSNPILTQQYPPVPSISVFIDLDLILVATQPKLRLSDVILFLCYAYIIKLINPIIILLIFGNNLLGGDNSLSI